MRVVPVLSLLFGFLATPLFAALPSSDPIYREGLHYFLVSEPVAKEQEEKLEVTQVFWYGCSHCFHFEPIVLAWQETMADDLHFVYLPAMWNREMEVHARVFYTAQRLGILEQAHQAIYNAINVDGERLNKPEAVAAFLAGFGVTEDVTEERISEIFASPEATAF